MANTVNISQSAVSSYMQQANGPVARKMFVVGEAVKVATIASLKQGFPRDFLGPKIVKRTVNTADGPGIQVGAVDTKTKPHGIDGNPLAFKWPAMGAGMFFFRHVNHPGSELGPYLQKKLIEALETVRGRI